MLKKVFVTIGAMLAASSLMGQGLQGRTFVYGEEVHLSAPLEISPTDPRPLSQILDEKLSGTDIDYRITEHHVLLFCRTPQQPTESQHIVHGYLTDALSGETLIGANVYCPALGAGTVTNAYGFYSLPLPQGRHALILSYVGYLNQVLTVDLSADETLNVALEPTRQLQEVVVESDRPETGAASTRMSATTVSVRQIEQTPSLLGEGDVIKALHVLPGVQTGFSGTSQMSVRGGNLDQNLILLDGILLYNENHIMGLESAFMPDAVKHVDFFRGSFPARYGGRLSSVADIRTKDGDMQKYHGLFSVGLLSSHISLEGPIVKDRTSFIISGRRSYADWFMKPLMTDDLLETLKFRLYFYDLNVKVNHKFSDTDRLYLSYYRGQDGLYNKFRETELTGNSENALYTQDMRWGNQFGNIRWNHLFSPSLFSNLTLGYNCYKMKSALDNVYREDGEKFVDNRYWTKFSSGIDDMMLLYDFDYHPSNPHHIKYGGGYTLHQFHPEVQSMLIRVHDDKTNQQETTKTDNSKTTGHELSLYAEDDMTLGQKWRVNVGLRGVLYGVKGACYPALEPRLSATYDVTDGVHLKGGYTLMHQYALQLTAAPLSAPTDLWVSVTKKREPMVAHQWALGLACNRWQGWELSTELYWKELRHVIDYVDGTGFYGSSKGWEDKVTQGEGRSYGWEFSASRTVGKTTGSLSYTLSHTDRCYPDGSINRGRRYPYEYDRRHVINILLQQQVTRHVDVNAHWTFATGGYCTVAYQRSNYYLPEANELYGEHFGEWVEEDYYSGKNNFKLKPRHQLDLSINIHHDTKHGERIWSFGVINAYRRLNQDLAWVELYVDEHSHVNPDTGKWEYTQTRTRKYRQMTFIPILPSVTYTYKF